MLRSSERATPGWSIEVPGPCRAHGAVQGPLGAGIRGPHGAHGHDLERPESGRSWQTNQVTSRTSGLGSRGLFWWWRRAVTWGFVSGDGGICTLIGTVGCPVVAYVRA